MHNAAPTFHIKWALNVVIYTIFIVFGELRQFTKTECGRSNCQTS